MTVEARNRLRNIRFIFLASTADFKQLIRNHRNHKEFPETNVEANESFYPSQEKHCRMSLMPYVADSPVGTAQHWKHHRLAITD